MFAPFNYTIGDIYGAHLNTAVTIAFWVGKEFAAKDIAPYIISQGIGAFIASFTLKFLFPANQILGSTLPSGSPMQSFILELILTFLLMFTILCVAKGTKEQGMFAGIAIGGVVLLEAMFAGPISGASMNPARSLAPAIVSGHTEHLWIYLIATTLGAALAIPTWKFLNQTDKK